ncbi:MAG: hypothetical protein AAGE76_16370 [Pseudomonadota bacterium]
MKRIFIALATLAAIALPAQAVAQGRACGDRERIIERLQAKYGETRTGAGLASSNGVVEIFASTETGTWTILITAPSGRACLMAAGENWQGNPGDVTKSGHPV